MFRLGLKSAITSDEHFHVAAEADDGRHALELIEEHKPAIAVLDWNMPHMNGLEVLRAVKERRLATRVIILTMHDDEGIFDEAIDAGVDGYVLKDNAVSDILDSLRTVEKGEMYLSPSISFLLLKRRRKAAQLREAKPELESLTPTEKKILALVAKSMTTKTIAAELGVSPFTVETHRRNISQKLGLSGSHSLLQFAIEHRAEL
jgi:DNA-binding NarL/FixJ family response regulator